jgi:hypothetical protein
VTKYYLLTAIVAVNKSIPDIVGVYQGYCPLVLLEGILCHKKRCRHAGETIFNSRGSSRVVIGIGGHGAELVQQKKE